MLKSSQTVCYEIFRDLERETVQPQGHQEIFLRVHPEIAHALKEEEHDSVLQMEKRIGQRIIITSRKDFHFEQYEISS